MAFQVDSSSTSSSRPTQNLTQDAGRYVMELFWLSLNSPDRIRMQQIKNQLEVSSASVSAMISQLAEDDIVDHHKYHGVTLTNRGLEMGKTLAWRFCVVDNFFCNLMDTPLDRSTVYELGYHLPEEGLVTLGEELGMPCTQACEGTLQSFDGCQLPPTAEG